jgi:hypothetical protein
MVVIMVVVMPGTRRISTGFGIEWRLDRLNMTAEAFDHVLDDMIRPNADTVSKQLHGQMPVAQMPCDPHEFAVIMRVDFQQRFRSRTNADDTAVFQRQAVAIPQSHRLRKIDQQFPSGLRCQNDAAAVAAIEIDQHLIDRVGPRTGWQDGYRAHQ